MTRGGPNTAQDPIPEIGLIFYANCAMTNIVYKDNHYIQL